MKHLIWLFWLFLFVNVCFWMDVREYGMKVSNNTWLVTELYDACKTAKDQTHCFWVWLSIAWAESSYMYWSAWYFWLLKPKDKSAYRRVKSYNKNWYKAQNGYFFYGSKGKLSPSRYCTSEHSSKSSVWCPNWAKNFDKIRNDYKRNTQVGDDTLYRSDNTYPKQGCQMVWIVKKDQYLQIDSFFGDLWRMLFPPKDSKVFICNSV